MDRDETPDRPEPPSSSGTRGSRLPDLGSKGGGWVALQMAIFGLAAATGCLGQRWPEPSRLGLMISAGVVFAAGIGLALAGGAGLGRQLTPFPRPVAAGQLRHDGVYALVRHPIYGGVLLILLAWALASSPWALLTFAAGAAFFEAKRRREETWLQEQYSAYADYRRRVRRKFLPFVW